MGVRVICMFESQTVESGGGACWDRLGLCGAPYFPVGLWPFSYSESYTAWYLSNPEMTPTELRSHLFRQQPLWGTQPAQQMEVLWLLMATPTGLPNIVAAVGGGCRGGMFWASLLLCSTGILTQNSHMTLFWLLTVPLLPLESGVSGPQTKVLISLEPPVWSKGGPEPVDMLGTYQAWRAAWGSIFVDPSFGVGSSFSPLCVSYLDDLYVGSALSLLTRGQTHQVRQICK